jgi:hypothetical protein
MAAAKKTAKPSATGKSMVEWDKELAAYADKSAAAEANAGTGLQSFSLKSGVLSLDDNPMPNNEVPVIVLSHIFENVFYLEDYDPDNPAPPTAYALGHDEAELRWSEDSIAELDDGEKIAGELCDDTSINQWGSADKGRGKACRNLRRLLVIPAGQFNKKTGAFELNTDEEHYAKAKPVFLKIPVMSTPNWSNYVKSLAANLRKPPFVVATRIRVVPDAKSQFKVTFEALEEMPNSLFATLVKRHEEADTLIMQPYDMTPREEREPAPRRSARAKPAAKKAAKKTGRRY